MWYDIQGSKIVNVSNYIYIRIAFNEEQKPTPHSKLNLKKNWP